MGIREEESGPVSYLVGYLNRDYGASALYVRKNLVIDASALPSGITIACSENITARVLAVYGNLIMKNVSMTGGKSLTVDIKETNPAQLYTLGRGGAIAVWGTATLTDCRIYGNSCVGDFEPSRDRGAFGGGIYADQVKLTRCTISGNTVLGAGAGGGGVCSVGGANVDYSASIVNQCSITGNRISGLYAYGGGIYSDGGGIGNSKSLNILNSTIARNLTEPAPGISFLLAMGYWRGGAAYFSNGSLSIDNCTIVENEVRGVPRVDSLGKQNMAGAVAATIGNAHAVERMTIGRSIITGNIIQELNTSYEETISYNHDIFTGSLTNFNSRGYNLIGIIDFSQILVPIEQTYWSSLCRRHFPAVGDTIDVNPGDVLDLALSPETDPLILSAGVNDFMPVPVAYLPKGAAIDQIPEESYPIRETLADISIAEGATNNFLWIVLKRIESLYSPISLPVDFATAFKASFENFLLTVDADEGTEGTQAYKDPSGEPILTLEATHWFGPAATWPKELPNYPYIEFWHQLDETLRAAEIPGMGPETLNDSIWSALFASGPLTENPYIDILIETSEYRTIATKTDQLGFPRPENLKGDIGSIELSHP
jgi:hypothetical protein